MKNSYLINEINIIKKFINIYSNSKLILKMTYKLNRNLLTNSCKLLDENSISLRLTILVV